MFHTELGRDGPGLLLRDALDDDPQVLAVRRLLEHMRPDILLLADIDYDAEGHAVAAVLGKLGPVYPHRFARLPNSGLWRDDDGDGDGRLGEAEDREGYGAFAGAGGAVLLSRLPIGSQAEDLTAMPWRDLKGGLHGPDLRSDLRLSTRMHWDVPVVLPDGEELRLWAWHATAPVFDGPEDAKGRRNRDEAQVWLNRLERVADEPVILIGVANLDPADGDGRSDALNALLSHDRLQDPQPGSEGGRSSADADHIGPPELDTVSWPSPGPGNLRVDYILPDRRFRVLDAGVFWPRPGSAEDRLLGRDVEAASRHRVVWLDLELQR